MNTVANKAVQTTDFRRCSAILFYNLNPLLRTVSTAYEPVSDLYCSAA